MRFLEGSKLLGVAWSNGLVGVCNVNLPYWKV